MSPRLTLAIASTPARGLDGIARAGAIIATNPSSNLHLRSGIAPIGEALARGCRVALGVDASAFDEDDDILREMRLGHFLHGGWGFEGVVERAPWLAGIVANGRFANGAPGTGALAVANRRTCSSRSRQARPRRDPAGSADRLPLRPRDRAHIAELRVAGRKIVADGKPTGVDLAEVEARLREQYRTRMQARAPFLAAWSSWARGRGVLSGRVRVLLKRCSPPRESEEGGGSPSWLYPSWRATATPSRLRRYPKIIASDSHSGEIV